MLNVIYAPNKVDYKPGQKYIFLAGSIEMGTAERWQDTVLGLLEMWHTKNVTLLNPRRSDWDDTWKQSITNPKFYEQVIWELDALKNCDKILMYFDPETKSPISLLELGLHARDNKLVVVCPNGFWRKGNVDIVCEYYGIPQVSTLAEAVRMVIH